MRVNGSPIDEYHFLPSPGAIIYSLSFELQQARAAAGLSIAEFTELPGDPIWTTDEQPMCKAELLVWYRMSTRIPAVQSDLQNREAQRKARSRGR